MLELFIGIWIMSSHYGHCGFGIKVPILLLDILLAGEGMPSALGLFR